VPSKFVRGLAAERDKGEAGAPQAEGAGGAAA